VVILYFFGPDGAGKTTLAEGLAQKIRNKNHKMKLSWMRGSHTIASLLARILSRSNFFKGSENPYYNISIPKKLKRLWQFIEFISALPIIISRFLIPSFMGYWIIADRYTLDLAVWTCLTTRDSNFLEKLEAKVLIASAKKTNAKFYVKADLETLRNRAGKFPFPAEQIRLYDRLAQTVEATIIDTTYKSADEALQEVLKALETVNSQTYDDLK
jgi:thymidylate kinase